MSEIKQENKDDLTEVNKEIEEYLIKKMEDPNCVVEDDDEEFNESSGLMGMFLNSMTIIIVLIALIRLGNLILQWFK